MDDEAFVETVDDIGTFQDDEKAEFERQSGEFQGSSGFFTINPWVIVLVACVIYYFYNRNRQQLSHRYQEWKQARDEAAEAAAIKKDPDAYRSKMEAMDRARRQLQEKYDREAAVALEKAKELEEKKRLERLEELENLTQGKGYRNKIRVAEAEFSDGVDRTNSSQGKRRPMLRPEHNPLMGYGSSGGYRPERRGNTGGG